jgi:hypothetical protein
VSVVHVAESDSAALSVGGVREGDYHVGVFSVRPIDFGDLDPSEGQVTRSCGSTTHQRSSIWAVTGSPPSTNSSNSSPTCPSRPADSNYRHRRERLHVTRPNVGTEPRRDSISSAYRSARVCAGTPVSDEHLGTSTAMRVLTRRREPDARSCTRDQFRFRTGRSSSSQASMSRRVSRQARGAAGAPNEPEYQQAPTALTI